MCAFHVCNVLNCLFSIIISDTSQLRMNFQFWPDLWTWASPSPERSRTTVQGMEFKEDFCMPKGRKQEGHSTPYAVLLCSHMSSKQGSKEWVSAWSWTSCSSGFTEWVNITHTNTHMHTHHPATSLHSNLLNAGVVQAEFSLWFVSTEFLVVVKALSSGGTRAELTCSHLSLEVPLPCMVH